MIELRVEHLRSLAWCGDDLIDWLGGWRVPTDGRAPQRFGTGSTYRFDSAVGHRELGITFEALGTKGRVARWNGVLPSKNWIPLGIDELREIDRSYYHADDYTYPITAFTLPDGRDVIAHCPRRYDRVDLELPDGTLLTPRDGKHEDCFHSRLEASPDGRWLLCNGWQWHPVCVAHVWEVARARDEPAYLSTTGISIDHGGTLYDGDMGIIAATLARDRVIAASEAHLGVFALPSGEDVHIHATAEPVGTRLVAWGDDHVVAIDGTPRVIELATGRVVERWDGLDGGRGLHQPSASMKALAPPWLAADPRNHRVALGWPDRIVIVS
jgi:hypothetical protein